MSELGSTESHANVRAAFQLNVTQWLEVAWTQRSMRGGELKQIHIPKDEYTQDESAQMNICGYPELCGSLDVQRQEEKELKATFM